MSTRLNRKSPIRLFASDTRGAALVEFGLVLPLVLLLFVVIMESARIFWSYQATISGVRDATRYVARVVSKDVDCATAAITDYVSASRIEEIVRESSSGEWLLPPMIAVSFRSADLTCVSGNPTPYRNDPAPVATVSVDVTFKLPFAPVFRLVGGTSLSEVSTIVADSSRIYGT